MTRDRRAYTIIEVINETKMISAKIKYFTLETAISITSMLLALFNPEPSQASGASINKIVTFRYTSGYPAITRTHCGRIVRWYGGNQYGVLVNLERLGPTTYFVTEDNMIIIGQESCP